ncbi:hypothetical protein AB0I60_14540 [Actinosynnema sp. NPDC050436]|uniref:hypothetical protein n=1 Tax=Actinosynnema sp. NPDC050436 TaxID=3155659 RepID=UPI00340C9ACC
MVGTESGGDAVMRFSLAGLVMASATNAIVGVSDGVAWAWWVAGGCLLLAALLGGAWSVRRVRAGSAARAVATGRPKAGTSVP